MSFYTGKSVVVTGATGMIGRRLCERLLEEGAHVDAVGYIGEPFERFADGATTWFDDLTQPSRYKSNYFAQQDMVFHVAGVKGSAGIGVSRAADWLVPMLQMNTNVMEAARLAGVERMLLTSSSAVYSYVAFSEGNGIVREDDDARTYNRQPYDKYAGWAKLTMELQAQAYQEQYGWDKIAIVRLANVFGPWDEFSPTSAMAIPALIARAASGENPLKVWGTAEAERDYLYVDDCVEAMLLAMEHGADGEPLNIGSGVGTTMDDVMCAIVTSTPGAAGTVEYDISKGAGLKRKVLNCEKANVKLGWTATTAPAEGIRRTAEWYVAHKDIAHKRHNVMASR